MPRTFLSKNRYSITTAEDLSEIWGLSITQAALTLKEMTQKLTRSAIIPLEQRYRAGQMFEVCRIHGTMSTDTMDARCQSIHDNNFFQVLATNNSLWRRIQSRTNLIATQGLDKFVKEYGAL